MKTWATERTNYPREVVELCLSHAQGDLLERAYQRGDVLDKRRPLMQEWADFCERGDQQADNVVPCSRRPKPSSTRPISARRNKIRERGRRRASSSNAPGHRLSQTGE